MSNHEAQLGQTLEKGVHFDGFLKAGLWTRDDGRPEGAV